MFKPFTRISSVRFLSPKRFLLWQEYSSISFPIITFLKKIISRAKVQNPIRKRKFKYFQKTLNPQYTIFLFAQQTWASNSTGDQCSKNIWHLTITHGRGNLESGVGTRLELEYLSE